MAKREDILFKIKARKIEKQAAKTAKYAKMRHTAENDPNGVEKGITNLAESCVALAEAFENLRENLDLIQAPKEAALKIRVAAARNYAKAFRRIAEETPEELASALAEAYHSLDEVAGALEQLADPLGVDLNATLEEEAFADEGIQELEEADERNAPVGDVPEPEEEKEAGSEGFVTDRDTSGQAKKLDSIDIPRAASGEGFITDRDKDANPERPTKAKIPQAQTEVGKQSKQKPMTQIVLGADRQREALQRRLANRTAAPLDYSEIGSPMLN